MWLSVLPAVKTFVSTSDVNGTGYHKAGPKEKASALWHQTSYTDISSLAGDFISGSFIQLYKLLSSISTYKRICSRVELQSD